MLLLAVISLGQTTPRMRGGEKPFTDTIAIKTDSIMAKLNYIELKLDILLADTLKPKKNEQIKKNMGMVQR